MVLSKKSRYQSPLSSEAMCVCASMKPGRIVASPRSMTCAPAGTAPPIDLIRLPSITTTAFFVTASEVPSKSRAAFRAIVFGCCAAAEIAKAKRRTDFLNMREKVAHGSAKGIHNANVAVNAIVLEVLGKEFVEAEDFRVGPHVGVEPGQLIVSRAAQCRAEYGFVWINDRELGEQPLDLLPSITFIKQCADVFSWPRDG